MSDAAIVTVTDDHVAYRASALGSCTRALVAARQGFEAVPPFESALELFQAGHDEEVRFTTKWPLEKQQTEVVLSVTQKIQIVGHIDGARGGRIVEIKSQSPDGWDKWTHDIWTTDPLWQKYAWQVSIYMIAQGSGLELVRINRETGKAVSTFYEMPFHTRQEIVERVLLIEMLAAENGLPETCDKDDWICPYRYTHPTLEPVDDPELEQDIVSYQATKERIEELKGKLSTHRADIERRLAGRKKVLLVSGATVTFSEYETKEHVVKASKQARLTVKKGPS
jgi:hypothetical protein